MLGALRFGPRVYFSGFGTGGKRFKASGALYLLELYAEEVVDCFSSILPTLVCLPSSPRSQTHYVEEDDFERMILLPLLPQRKYYNHAF